MNTCVQTPLHTFALILLGIYPEIELLDHMVILLLFYLVDSPICFPEEVHHFTFPRAVHRVPTCAHPHQHLLFLHAFDSSHPNGCEVFLVLFKEHKLLK